MNDKPKLLISFSGGRTSAFMTKWLLDTYKNRYEMVVVFANTGKEREETLEFIKKCDDELQFNTVWVESVMRGYKKGPSFKIVNFESASRKGEPFEAMIAKHGIPNQSTPHCTRELKKYAIRAYMREIGWTNYYTAIGYRHDEPKRINRHRQKKDRQIYPLFDEFAVTKEWINQYWQHQSFNLNLKNYQGNCDLCWKKHEKKLLTIIQEEPERAEWWLTMQEKYENYTPASRMHNNKIKQPHRFYRGNTSVTTLIDRSRQYFEPAKDDDAKEVYRQLLLYSDFGVEESKGCEESCEPF